MRNGLSRMMTVMAVGAVALADYVPLCPRRVALRSAEPDFCPRCPVRLSAVMFGRSFSGLRTIQTAAIVYLHAHVYGACK